MNTRRDIHHEGHEGTKGTPRRSGRTGAQSVVPTNRRTCRLAILDPPPGTPSAGSRTSNRTAMRTSTASR